LQQWDPIDSLDFDFDAVGFVFEQISVELAQHFNGVVLIIVDGAGFNERQVDSQLLHWQNLCAMGRRQKKDPDRFSHTFNTFQIYLSQV
jgi:hypothetical protein